MYDRSPLFCRPWHLASSASVETQPNRDRDGSRPRVTQRDLCETVAPGVPSPNSWARGAPFLWYPEGHSARKRAAGCRHLDFSDRIHKGSFVSQLLQVCPALSLGRSVRPSYGTRKGTVLESVPLGVATWTFPVVAPAGTVVVISELETTVNTAAVPLKVTLVAPVRSLPRMLRGSHFAGARPCFHKRAQTY